VPLVLVDAPLPLVQRHSVSDAWAINTYRACDIRCTYCITTAQGRSQPRFPAAEVAARLEAELDAVGEIDRIVVGPYCDVYPSPEAELGVTRAALQVLDRRGLDFRLITKGPTVVRDIDLLGDPRNLIQISICMLDPAHVARYEPGAASADERLAALHELDDAGVHCLVQATPWIPGITDALALRRRVRPEIRIQVTPLRLPWYLDRADRAFGFTQAEVNEAYHREYDRVRSHPDCVNVVWSRPPALDGAPPHISDNLGAPDVDDWSPSPPAPVLTAPWYHGRGAGGAGPAP
jgi:DNA repair photolyase